MSISSKDESNWELTPASVGSQLILYFPVNVSSSRAKLGQIDP